MIIRFHVSYSHRFPLVRDSDKAGVFFDFTLEFYSPRGCELFLFFLRIPAFPRMTSLRLVSSRFIFIFDFF